MKEFSLLDILRIVLKKIWLVLAVAVIFMTAALLYCNLLAVPMYSANSSIIISNGALEHTTNTNKIQSADLATSLALTQPITDILDTKGMYTAVAEKTIYNYTADQLKGMFDLSFREDSIIIDVKITTTDPQHSVQLANTFVHLAPDYLSAKLPSAQLTINEEAERAVQVSPQTTLTAIGAFLLGAILIIVVLVIYNSLDQTIKGEESITSNYNVPILGMVPDFDNYQKVTKGGKA